MRDETENKITRDSSRQQQHQELSNGHEQSEQSQQSTVDYENNSLSSTLQSLAIDEARKEANKVQVISANITMRVHHKNKGLKNLMYHT